MHWELLQMVENGQKVDVVSAYENKTKQKKKHWGKKKLHDLRQLPKFWTDVSTEWAVYALPLQFNDCQEHLAL